MLAKVRKYFERIPSQPPPPPVDLTEPPQQAERRQTIDDKLAKLSRVDIVFHAARRTRADDDAMNVLASVLSSGRSSRFYEKIVRQAQLTTGVNAFNDTARGPGLFRVLSLAQPGKSIADLEAAIYAEIERVKTEPIADWEIEKAISSEKRSFVSGLGSSLQRAVLLGEFAAFWDDPNLINTYVDRLSKVTAADVQRVAQQYLVQTNRTVVITNPKSADGREREVDGGHRRFLRSSALLSWPHRWLARPEAPAARAAPGQAVTMKGRAPVSTELLKIKLPRPAEVDLPNGIHLMVLEDHRVPLVTFQLQIPGAGGYFDPADQPVVAQMTATMMREGTASKNTLQISETLETKASTVKVGAGLSSTLANVSGSSLTENFDATFSLAADILLSPSFPQEEFDRYKTRTRTGLVQQRSQPGFLASELFAR